jgi:hypothetical protein
MIFAPVVLTLAMLSIPARGAAPKKTEKADSGRAAAEKALRAEVSGEINRRDKLVEALRELPDSPFLRWQAGFVRAGKMWSSYDEPRSPDTLSTVRDEYKSRRRDAQQTFAGQIELANWCKKQGLTDQERAHLSAALPLSPSLSHADIRYRLGWRRVGDTWLSPDELREWQRLVQMTGESLKRWTPKLTHVSKGLSGSPRQRAAALTALKEITDPLAVSAIEIGLAGGSEVVALPAIDALRQIDTPLSTVALAKQAVFSQSPEVRNSASAALKSRRRDDFVPALMSLLASPIEMRATTPTVELRAGGPRSRLSWQFALVVSYVLFRETGDQFQVATLQTTNYQINERVNGQVITPNHDPAGLQGLMLKLDLGRLDALRTSFEQIRLRERTIDEINQQTALLNGRIGAVLAAISGKDPSSSPQVWWDWWRAESDTQLAGEKTTYYVAEEDFVGNPQSGYVINLDCLAAGTPVWTDAGLVPIETIAVGDLILAQDIETGELAYKPVLRTTLRPPKELCTIRFSEESVVSTAGHRFWDSGTGWVKVRDLAPQTLLHTVTGNAPVWTAKKGETAQTYNLLVADFHTFFVGQTGILSQDVLTPRGTDCVVPGLPRANAVAASGK